MIIVKKPFDFIPFIKEKKKENKEEEEKPPAAVKMLSEDAHGGEESTDSLPDTPSQSLTSSSEAEEKKGEEKEEEKEEEKKGEEKEEKKEEEKEEEERKEEEEEKEKEGEEEEKEEGEEEEKEKEEIEEEIEEEEEEEEEEEIEEEEEEEIEEEIEEEEEEEFSSGFEEEEEEEFSSEFEEEEEEIEEEEEEEEFSSEFNSQQAFDFDFSRCSRKLLQTEFYRFLELFSEEKTKIFAFSSPEEYNIKKLMFKQFEKKPLSFYKQARVRDTVLLILDNSGSMEWWAEAVSALAQLALERGGVEVFIAPNGCIEEKLVKEGKSIPADRAAVMKTAGRKIIYVGDFDGADTPVELSWRNEVVWVCPEPRYRRFESHDWVSYTESDFKGAFLRVYTISELFAALKRLFSRQAVGRVWIDLHENSRFEDDSWRQP